MQKFRSRNNYKYRRRLKSGGDMNYLESNLYWQKRRQTILQSLNAQPTNNLPCACNHALCNTNASTYSSGASLIKKSENVTTSSCTCKHLNTSPGSCQMCRISPSRTKLNNSPVKMNGHATLENISPRFMCKHQGLVPNNSCWNSFLSFR